MYGMTLCARSQDNSTVRIATQTMLKLGIGINGRAELREDGYSSKYTYLQDAYAPIPPPMVALRSNVGSVSSVGRRQPR